jgi:prolipoprotein diacylglyceryltransferase
MIMMNEIFVIALGLLFGAVLVWSWRTLPQERWQVLAVMPIRKNGGDTWEGLNITFYGVFHACSITLASILALIMLGSINVDPLDALLLMAPLLSVCVPASRIVARIVEGKPQTITVAGAAFVGLILAPWLTLAARQALGDRVGDGMAVLPVLAAIATAYAFGEGLGRLACISYGCCYGKPLSQCPPIVQRLFRNHGFVFTGHTKKISYESNLAGTAVVPIQAVTSVVCVAAGLAGLYLFLRAQFAISAIAVLAITQGWRAFSETLRADYRGKGKLTVYQYMAFVAIGYGVLIALLFPSPAQLNPILTNGLAELWSPWVLLVLQGLWFITLYNYGRSRVTGSTLTFHVRESEI